MTRTARRISLIVVVALGIGLSGCSSQEMTTRDLAPGEYALALAQTTMDGHRLLCAGGGFPDGVRIHGSANDPHVVWLTFVDGKRVELVWPAGFKARFAPNLEVLDPSGVVYAREGFHPAGGCPMGNGWSITEP